MQDITGGSRQPISIETSKYLNVHPVFSPHILKAQDLERDAAPKVTKGPLG